jgi:DNA topoisomerase-1
VASKRLKGLVIVESPAKAKKIGGFLGSDYKVMASFGHVRDLPASAAEIPSEVKKLPWSRLGVNVDSSFEPVYVVPKEKKKVVTELKAALKDADELILATDEDREGESIGWHLMDLLNPKVPVKRMVFSEITREAILDALQHTRQLDENLVSAQETRRVVDRLYGYTLSPLLWKKVAPRLSTGRVQSVAVRLLVQRERERVAFRSAMYWDLKATLETGESARFDAVLATVGGQRIASGRDFDETTGRLKADAQVVLLDEATARALHARISPTNDDGSPRSDAPPWKVTTVETRPQTRKPYPPFTTSTLQQEANRKLGLSARDTMRVAQRLYEEGLITYMRTDSVSLSNEAVDAARRGIRQRYGDPYLSPAPRQFTTKSKNAQEAHEAIRPAGTEMKTADEQGLSGLENALYSLIWKRTMATQMAEARLLFQTVTIAAEDAEFRATGRHVEFPGFFRAYVEGVDDPEAALDDQEAALPPLSEGATLGCRQVDPLPHETKPPARFTEATLIRKLEEEGVGRPSTYATIIGTIQDRGYVRKTGSQLVPTFTAMAVTQLLERHFPRLVDLGFTAKMEQTLDDIASGEGDRVPYLTEFYSGEEGLDLQVKKNESEIDAKAACTLNLGELGHPIRVGRYGPYVEEENNGETIKANIPDDVAPADLTTEYVDRIITQKVQGPIPLGMHPEQALPVYVRSGPFGPYIQLGDQVDDGPKPKRVGVPKNIDSTNLSLDMALKLLDLPHRLGHHPVTNKVVNAGVGRFGPYVQHDGVYKSFGKDGTTQVNGRQVDVLSVQLEDAVEMLKDVKKRGQTPPIREIGPHPEDQAPVQIFDGKFGPYVKHGAVNATIPKERDPQTLTMEEAVALLAERAARGPSKGRGRGRGAKAAKAPVAKKAPATKKAKAAPTPKAAASKKAAPKKKAAKKKATKAAKKAKSTKKAPGESPPQAE